MVNATNVSNWAELIYGDVRIDRRPLVIPVGREVKGGGKRARRDSGVCGLWYMRGTDSVTERERKG